MPGPASPSPPGRLPEHPRAAAGPLASETRKIAHDLKNLMTVITLNAELVRGGSGGDASRAESLTRIQDAAETAVSLIRWLTTPEPDSVSCAAHEAAAGEDRGAPIDLPRSAGRDT